MPPKSKKQKVVDEEEDNLQVAQEALDQAQVVKPDKVEIDAIKQFCTLEVSKRNAHSQYSAQLKDLRAKQKALKLQLTNDFSEQTKSMALSKAQVKQYEELSAASGIAPMFPYLRLVPANKDSSISPEVVQEALESITLEDIQEASTKNANDSSTASAIRTVVLTNIRRLIRSFTESLKILSSLPKGHSVYDLVETSDAVAERMWSYWSVEQEIKTLLASKKVSSDDSQHLKDLKAKVEAFFIRTGLSVQRISVEGHAYKLSRKVSVRKPKVGIGKLELLLDEILPQFTSGPLFKPKELIRAIQIQLSAIAPETKSNVTLSPIKADTTP